MSRLNYLHLRAFWAVAHEGNLTRAAERLHVSASALSTQLRSLEEQLGQPLFERNHKRLVLTEAGRIALEHADAIFRTGDELMDTLEGRGPATRQVLRIGALATLSRNFQIGLLRPFVNRTDIELVVRSGSMRELLAQLDTLALDVVLSNLLPPADAETPRISRVLDLVSEHHADGVVHYGLRLCQLFDMELYRLSALLKERKIPFMNLRTDYSLEDTEQLRVRLEAFIETLEG